MQGLQFPIVLFPQRINISIVIATFSFTTLGFLAAIITVLFGLIHSVTFKKYKKKGYLELLFFVYWFSIANLLATFILALLNFSSRCLPVIFNIMLMSAMNNIVQISFITIIILNLVRKSSTDAAAPGVPG